MGSAHHVTGSPGRAERHSPLQGVALPPPMGTFGPTGDISRRATMATWFHMQLPA